MTMHTLMSCRSTEGGQLSIRQKNSSIYISTKKKTGEPISTVELHVDEFAEFLRDLNGAWVSNLRDAKPRG